MKKCRKKRKNTWCKISADEIFFVSLQKEMNE